MKHQVKLSGFGRKLQAPCLRRGVVVGRAACSVNDLNTQLVVLTEADPMITRGALKDLRGSITALRRGLRAAPAEIQALDDAAARLEKGLRGKPATWLYRDLRAELRLMQESFRKAVKAGLAECGADGLSPTGMAVLVDDNAFLIEEFNKSKAKETT